MSIRGVRGATVAIENEPVAVLSATRELLSAMLKANSSMSKEDIASVLFTTTADLDTAFPAAAARQLGWENVALMCAQEIRVKSDIPYCIRVLLHWNTDKPQSEIVHVYLREAMRLRPDLVGKDQSESN